MHLHVHLVFAGNCEEAFKTYAKLFNGSIDFIFRKGDEQTIRIADDEKNKISHIILNTEHFSLQGEDVDAGVSVETGSSKLVLEFRDIEKLKKIFKALSKEGVIITPLEKTFFSEAIGEVVDRFGVRWLIMMTDEDYEV